MEPNKKNESYDGSLSSYMKEAGQYALLNREEENSLSALIRRWVDSPRPSKAMKSKGEEAKNLLIKSNLRLVIKIAKQYRNLGLDFSDLIAEGNLGLIESTTKFKTEKGAKFSYYASFWIKQSIRRAISNKGRTIRLPVAVIDAKIKIIKFIDGFKLMNFRDPTEEEVSEKVGLPAAKVKFLSGLNFQSKSLNEKLDKENDSGAEVENTIENIESDNPYKVFMEKDDTVLLNKFLRRLDERQQYIIKYRFGLGDVESKTLEAIGTQFNLTRERIRQLESIALDNLRVMYKKIKKYDYNENK